MDEMLLENGNHTGLDVLDEEICRYIGARIKARREACGLTQEKLEALSRCSSTTISRAERGIQILNAANLVRIARALKVSVRELIGIYEYADAVSEDTAAKHALVRDVCREAAHRHSSE